MKLKITLALVLLFGLLVLVGTLGILRINALADDAHEILKDNHLTLVYVQQMQRALDSWTADTVSRGVFAENLKKQRQNVTEQGEQDATDALVRYFEVLKKSPSDSLAIRAIRENLLTIGDLNLEAIARKNDHAGSTAERSVALLGIITTISIIIGFSFLINFPGYVANPVRELTAGIREIAQGNYNQRLRLNRQDEFGELATAFNELAAKLDAYEHSSLARLMFEKRRLETIIGALHDPVIVLDEDYKILFANPPARDMLHLTAPKLIGRDVREIALGNDLMRALLQRTDPSAEAEPLKIFANGKESFFQLETFEINVPAHANDETPQPIGQVLFLKNITLFRERDLAKTNFIATISHELKTPISAMKMGLSLLDDQRVGPLNSEQRELLQQINLDANRLLSITGELLKLAQAETGNIQLSLEPTSPAQLVETARQALLAQAAEKNIVLQVGETAAGEVLADPDKAAWVLVNLLSNAIRHSPEGQTVGISMGLSGEFLRISVHDHGSGVPAEWQEKIFDRYVRVPGASAGGTGLGLAISREFVQAMGGAIGVESRPGEGSTFWFTLRRAGG